MKFLIGKLAKLFSYALYLLPTSGRIVLAHILGFFAGRIIRLRRQVAFENLNRAFPELTQADLIKRLNKSYFHMALGLFEYACLPFMDSKWVKSHARIEGIEFFNEAVKKDKGVLLLSLHLGNGDLGCAVMSLAGLRLHLISKQFKLKWLNELWFGMRSRLGTRFIAPEASTYEILAALKKKEAVIFVLDQFMGPPVGVRTKFFGHETGTALGLSIFHQKTKAPLLMVYSYRELDGTLVVKFSPEILLIEKNERKETHSFMTQVYTDRLEELVRKYPEQWMWIHRRWKEFKE